MCRQYPVTFFKFSADRWGFFSYLTRDKWVNLDADIIKTGSGSGMFLLIHHLTFPRDSYSDLISSQLSHHTLETSTEVRKSWFSSYKSLSCSFEFFIFLLRLSSFFFFFPNRTSARERGREARTNAVHTCSHLLCEVHWRCLMKQLCKIKKWHFVWMLLLRKGT